MSARESFGHYLRERRVEIGMTLREFCRQVGESPGNISRMERDQLAPPDSEEKLERFAQVLSIVERAKVREFIDRACFSRGSIPVDIMSDDQLMESLPLVFRTLRGQRLSEDSLRDLAEVIRRS